MKRKNSNKNIFIIVLLILLLALSIGYAAFSDILTISGTANAKGTFDLEFQNAQVVKNVGADLDKTTAIISEDKNTLTVNVADLSYPGSGVEFSVDIVNVGTIPAEVQAVTPTNVTGSKKIKVSGLDVIKTNHPKIEAGDKCNIHFTVEWPADAGEILENESSISFGLEIEYAQSTGELFEGNTSHTDTDKNGNTVNGGVVEKPTYKTLVSQITAEDYGKAINYKATVTNNENQIPEEVSNWKVLYNDKNNIYLILDNFLPIELVPTESRISIKGTYEVYSDSRDNLLNGLSKASYWYEFANGYEGAEAQGAPDFDIIMKSYNEKYGTNLKTDSTLDGYITFENTDILYTLPINAGGEAYFLNASYPNTVEHLWGIGGNGSGMCWRAANGMGLRPVIILPSTTIGTVGEIVEIIK